MVYSMGLFSGKRSSLPTNKSIHHLCFQACNIVESFMPDPTWKNFQRPSKEPDSLGFGFPRFVSHEMLKKRHFLKDDTMFIRVKVDPSKIVAV